MEIAIPKVRCSELLSPIVRTFVEEKTQPQARPSILRCQKAPWPWALPCEFLPFAVRANFRIGPWRAITYTDPPAHAMSFSSAATPRALRNRRIRDRRNPADGRGARRQRRSRDQQFVTLGRSRTTRHANARKSIAVEVRPRESVRQCFQKFDDLILLCVRQAQITASHIDIVPHLWHGPAIYFFGRSCGAMSGSHRVRILVARIVEVYELLQALDVAVVKEPLLEIRAGCFGRGTLRRCHRHVARRRHLHLAVDTWRVLFPTAVRAGSGTESTSQETPQSQISVSESVRIGSEAIRVRLGLVIESISRIQRQALIGRAEAGEQRIHHGARAGVGLT